MSAITNTVITLGGLSALAYTKAHALPLVFTRMEIGDGFNTGELEEQSSLVNRKLNLPLTNIEKKEGGVVWVETSMSNTDLTEGFYYREIGLYCQNPENTAEEILYCYGNAGELAEFVVADNSTTAVLKTIRLVLNISNEQTATINMNDENHATNNYVDTSIKNAISEHITNCILEIPQDVKVDIINGVLTVYAGSKVTVPYGTAAPTLKIGDSLVNDNFKIVNISYENSQLFYQVEIQNDITDSYVINDTNTRLIEIDLSTGSDVQATIYTKSGTDASSFSGVFYNYEKNTLASYVSGSTSNNVLSLPIAQTTADGVNLYGSLDKVFNGVTYCGGSLFALPGVKGLIPTGNNPNGTIDNISLEVTQVLTTYLTGTGAFTLTVTPEQELYAPFGSYFYQEDEPEGVGRWFNPVTRVWKLRELLTEEWRLDPQVVLATGEALDSVITSLDTKTTFRALDYFDYKKNLDYQNQILRNLINEKDFEIESLAKMIELDLTKLFIQIFEDTKSIDTTKGDGAYCIANYYEKAAHIFIKNDTTTRVIYSVAKTVTTGNNKVWTTVNWTNVASGTVTVEISRDGGTTWTTLTQGALTDISTQPAGTSMILRVTVTGSLRLKNIAWGMKA